MNSNLVKSATIERETGVPNGWLMLAVNLTLILGSIAWLLWLIFHNPKAGGPGYLILAPILTEALGILFITGHFTLQPNEARVLILFGAYKGTVRRSGFWWANPFYSRLRSGQGQAIAAAVTHTVKATGGLSSKISLRTRNFNSEKLKVNDKRGNPIEIAAVIVWRVEDTAKAAFDVEDFESYVHIQSESAIRHIASIYAYDRGEQHEPTLRESADEIAAALKKELLERLDKAGVVVEEARLTHLAYAPEIAQAMLRRQQAEAVISARQTIVQSAVSMVEMALRQLTEREVVKLDEERKAAMVSNLLVVLCGETEASPVINTGTLYS
jgi:regulator of protease activity HflC (stomatin/prohibitin superfamily)